MKNLFSAIIIFVVAGFFVCLHLLAAVTDSVTATVMAQNISVTVTDGVVAYGTVATSSARTTATGDGDSVDDSQTATNDGNIVEDFNIMGIDSAAWELADAVGSETYAHGFCITNCDTTPTWTQFNETSYTQLANSISATSNQIFDMRLQTPTSTATFTQQSVDVTVQAVAD